MLLDYRRKPMVAIQELLPDLRTGDVFLARGRMWISRLIEWVTDCPWSHVGLIVLPHDVGFTDVPNRPHLWESTTMVDVRDLNTGCFKQGPMLVDLEERVEKNLASGHYKVMAIRYLNRELSGDEKKALQAFVTCDTVRQATFATYWGMIWESFRSRFLEALPPEKTYYCSQLVSQSYMEMGVLPERPSPKSYVPRDYSTKGYAPLLHRTLLAHEVYVGGPGNADVTVRL